MFVYSMMYGTLCVTMDSAAAETLWQKYYLEIKQSKMFLSDLNSD